jgi:EpsI family protein
MTTEWARILVPLFLAGQGVLVYWSAGSERPPQPPALAQFPARFAAWTELRADPLDRDVVNTLNADQLLSRTYIETAGVNRSSRDSAPLAAGFLVAWFRSQRGGASQPHSPKVCLPASGWTPASSGEMTISTGRGPITVNRYVVANRGERAVVLYWYQSARRATAGEWASKFWLVADAVRDQRSDMALVRIVVEEPVQAMAGGDEQATRTAADFARAAYPLLRDWLPK